MIKPSKVVFVSDELEKDFNALKEDDPIKKGIMRAIKDLKENAFCGIQIPKRLIPKEYLQKYKVDNLWKYNLPNAWRLLYSVGREEVIIVSIVLEWLDHTNYNRKFGYKTSYGDHKTTERSHPVIIETRRKNS